MGNAANVIGELLLGKQIDFDLLIEASMAYPVSVVQRTGWLIEHMASELEMPVDLDQLRRRIEHSQPTRLDPHGPAGQADSRWKLVINTEVEHDL